MTTTIDLGKFLITSVLLEHNGPPDKIDLDGASISTYSLEDEQVGALRDAMLNDRQATLTIAVDGGDDE